MHIKRFNLEIEKAYAIGLTAIHIHSFPYLLEEFIDSLYVPCKFTHLIFM